MSKCKVKRLNVNHYRLAFLLLFITILSLSVSVQANEKPYPGKLINVGTHRLHINCTGEGSPSVIIDSGIGGFSLEWFKVQNKLSNDVKVCSYDRAGYGWSDPGPTPRTTARISRELRVLLSEAEIPAPYVLVGHSFGGYNIRYFASDYPDLVAGMVFVDASHPEQFNTEEFKREKSKSSVSVHKNSTRIRILRPVISNNYPREKVHTAYRLMSSFKAKMTLINESNFMDLSAKQVTSHSIQQPYTFPVVIITRGKRVWAHNEMGDRREQKWAKLQNDLENLSVNPKHLMAYNSGHVVHLDQPKLVTDNILLTANKARQQILEEELFKEDNMLQTNHFESKSFVANETTFDLSALNLDHYSLFDAPIHKTKFDPHFFYLRYRKETS
jgi:pimeloyl-ACP methyl ester carboxylesterase